MTEPTACPECLRRARLLAHLAPYIEKIATGAPGKRSPELLRLASEDLAAVAAPRCRRTACAPSSPRRGAGPAAATIRCSRWASGTRPTRRGRWWGGAIRPCWSS